MNQLLSAWAVPLDPDAARRWQDEYGVTDIYLNDIAAGAIIEVPPDWTPEDAVKNVATGLRHLLQDLWHMDLVRPLLAVYFPTEGSETIKRLRRLAWEDEWHQGDFALRTSRDREDAENLLYTLMGDTMGALDASAQSEQAGISEVRSALERRLAKMAEDSPEGRLVRSILDALDRAKASRTDPNLVASLESWVESEGGAP